MVIMSFSSIYYHDLTCQKRNLVFLSLAKSQKPSRIEIIWNPFWLTHGYHRAALIPLHMFLPPLVTKSKLILLAAQQVDELVERWGVGIRNSDFIQKAIIYRRCSTRVPQNHLTQIRTQASFILKGEWMWLFVANILLPGPFLLAAVHIGLVTMFLLISSKTKDTLYSSISNILFTKGTGPAWLSSGNRAHG